MESYVRRVTPQQILKNQLVILEALNALMSDNGEVIDAARMPIASAIGRTTALAQMWDEEIAKP